MNQQNLIISENDDRFYIHRSTIPGAGKGLFTHVLLTKGTDLEVAGILIQRNSVSDQCTHYADAYKFRVKNYLLIPLGYAAMVNHSSTKRNLKKIIVGKRLYLRTLRSIEPGEELFFCYHDYAKKKFSLKEI